MSAAHFKDLDGLFLADECIQPLAHAVPVDEENDARAQMPQVAFEIRPIGGAVRAGRQKVGSRFKLVARARIWILPRHVESGEEALEELEPRAMHVGVGERNGKIVDADNENVGIGACRYRSEINSRPACSVAVVPKPG